jgi:hypothetical protein
MDSTRFLEDWMITLLKSRDAFKKEIVSIEKQQGFFAVNCRDKVKHFFVLPLLEDSFRARVADDAYVGIITLSNKRNIRYLADKWNLFCTMRNLSIYFVNPLSDNEKLWIIMPYVHSKVCDEKTLEAGLLALAENTGQITEQELQAAVTTE